MSVDRTVIKESQVLEHRRDLLINDKPEEVLYRHDHLNDGLAYNGKVLNDKVLRISLGGDISRRYTKIL